uniref:C2H2-type domain-containing protein n=2 Tax=Leersia perrieri TaxID=77586 RepID=A0A0D9XXZ9_9ORYZ
MDGRKWHRTKQIRSLMKDWRMRRREDGRSAAYLVAMVLCSSCLLAVAAGSRQEFHEDAGSRERSRLAWKAIDEYLMPFVEKEKYELPSKCRLHPGNDMFREQEQHKIHFDINEWRCGFCKKAFRAEKFLDQHFENRHKNLVDNSHGRCLADLCGALHCDLMLEFKKPKSKCSASAAARNRHLCESLADSCFPINHGPSASRLHEFFLRQFCDAHTCNRGSKPFPKGGRKETNRFYLALCALIVRNEERNWHRFELFV